MARWYILWYEMICLWMKDIKFKGSDLWISEIKRQKKLKIDMLHKTKQYKLNVKNTYKKALNKTHMKNLPCLMN